MPWPFRGRQQTDSSAENAAIQVTSAPYAVDTPAVMPQIKDDIEEEELFLDYKLREQLREEFPKLLHKNVEGIILYTTTEPGEAMQLGDELIVMHEGRIVAQGDPEELFENPPSVEVAQVISDPPISICSGTISGGKLHFQDGSPVGAEELQLGSDGPVQIGIRPDALTKGGNIPARVSLSEFSGSDTVVHLHLPFGEVVMLVDGIHEYHSGDEFSVSLDTRALLLFTQKGANIAKRTE